ncbi:50S ribosomal protein L23 [Membranihabitans maritimus]|uniref:50S ribosomal protein L23 n=1 Tax=Membranihabitans maritimus TaxID=2904244 RepID=UPI001EFF94C5|nr:50S ribosomal protein L23 [Membranihabitans maritimus]
MANRVLIKPLITEKSDVLNDQLNKVSFIVDKKANKIEIRNAVESMYNVSVDSVNTAVLPGKLKVKFTRGGVQRGRKPSYKKAIVTLVEGEQIDLFGEL